MQTIQNNFGEIHGDSDMRDLARVTPEETMEENEIKTPRDRCAEIVRWANKMSFLRSIHAEIASAARTPASCLMPRVMFADNE